MSKRDISTMNFPDAVKFVMSVDILLAASGPALTMSIFLTPHSGIVEVMPENYRSGYYHHLASGSDVYYLAHTNFTSNLIPIQNCTYSISDTDMWSYPSECRKQFLKREVYIPPITLWMILTDMSNSVNHNKYHIFQ